GGELLLDPTGSFIAHPPLGKWIIALGMAAAGPHSAAGWRLGTAVFGTLAVLALYAVALLLTRSIAWATIAGGLFAIDGLGIVLSRIALLDGILTFFLLVGVLCILLDRRRSMPSLEDPAFHRRGESDAPPMWGRVLWRRPW